VERIREVFRGSERVRQLPVRRGAAAGCGFELAGASAPLGVGVGVRERAKGKAQERSGRGGEATSEASAPTVKP